MSWLGRLGAAVGAVGGAIRQALVEAPAGPPVEDDAVPLSRRERIAEAWRRLMQAYGPTGRSDERLLRESLTSIWQLLVEEGRELVEDPSRVAAGFHAAPTQAQSYVKEGECMAYVLEERIVEQLCAIGVRDHPPGMMAAVFEALRHIIGVRPDVLLPLNAVHAPVRHMLAECINSRREGIGPGLSPIGPPQSPYTSGSASGFASPSSVRRGGAAAAAAAGAAAATPFSPSTAAARAAAAAAGDGGLETPLAKERGRRRGSSGMSVGGAAAAAGDDAAVAEATDGPADGDVDGGDVDASAARVDVDADDTRELRVDDGADASTPTAAPGAFLGGATPRGVFPRVLSPSSSIVVHAETYRSVSRAQENAARLAHTIWCAIARSPSLLSCFYTEIAPAVLSLPPGFNASSSTSTDGATAGSSAASDGGAAHAASAAGMVSGSRHAAELVILDAVAPWIYAAGGQKTKPRLSDVARDAVLLAFGLRDQRVMRFVLERTGIVHALAAHAADSWRQYVAASVVVARLRARARAAAAAAAADEDAAASGSSASTSTTPASAATAAAVQLELREKHELAHKWGQLTLERLMYANALMLAAATSSAADKAEKRAAAAAAAAAAVVAADGVSPPSGGVSAGAAADVAGDAPSTPAAPPAVAAPLLRAYSLVAPELPDDSLAVALVDAFARTFCADALVPSVLGTADEGFHSGLAAAMALTCLSNVVSGMLLQAPPQLHTPADAGHAGEGFAPHLPLLQLMLCALCGVPPAGVPLPAERDTVAALSAPRAAAFQLPACFSAAKVAGEDVTLPRLLSRLLASTESPSSAKPDDTAAPTATGTPGGAASSAAASLQARVGACMLISALCNGAAGGAGGKTNVFVQEAVLRPLVSAGAVPLPSLHASSSLCAVIRRSAPRAPLPVPSNRSVAGAAAVSAADAPSTSPSSTAAADDGVGAPAGAADAPAFTVARAALGSFWLRMHAAAVDGVAAGVRYRERYGDASGSSGGASNGASGQPPAGSGSAAATVAFSEWLSSVRAAAAKATGTTAASSADSGSSTHAVDGSPPSSPSSSLHASDADILVFHTGWAGLAMPLHSATSGAYVVEAVRSLMSSQIAAQAQLDAAPAGSAASPSSTAGSPSTPSTPPPTPAAACPLVVSLIKCLRLIVDAKDEDGPEVETFLLATQALAALASVGSAELFVFLFADKPPSAGPLAGVVVEELAAVWREFHKRLSTYGGDATTVCEAMQIVEADAGATATGSAPPASPAARALARSRHRLLMNYFVFQEAVREMAGIVEAAAEAEVQLAACT